jgi:carbonic anhydrase/acetyltransferase-like protein (isoleucine patch superfamily)
MRRVGKAWIATTASVMADVTFGEDANVVAASSGDDAPAIDRRADRPAGRERAAHADTGVPCDVGSDVTVGHRARCCTARTSGLHALIRIGRCSLAGNVVGEGAIVAAGCVVPAASSSPWTLVVGVLPASSRPSSPAARRADA